MENINYSAPVPKHSGRKAFAFFNAQKLDRVLQLKLQALFPTAEEPIPPASPSLASQQAARRAHIEILARPKSVSTRRNEIKFARYLDDLSKQREIPRLEPRVLIPSRTHFRIPSRNGPLHHPDSGRLQEARERRSALQMKQEAQERRSAFQREQEAHKNKLAFFRKYLIDDITALYRQHSSR